MSVIEVILKIKLITIMDNCSILNKYLKNIHAIKMGVK
jgi:hypothetical protein